MLMLVARMLEGRLMMGCLAGGGGATLDPVTGVDEDWACLEDGVEEDGLDDLTGVVEDTWAIFALSPWFPASSLRVSMMETVCT